MKKYLLLFLFLSSAAFAAEFVPTTHSTAYESSHIITTDPTKALYWITVTWETAANRWLIIYNSKTVPVDGMLVGSNVLYCGIVSLTTDGSTGTKSFDFTQHPLQYGPNKTIPLTALGQVAIISTDPGGCLVKAADGPNNWITAGFN